MNSCLYECHVMHARFAPRQHRFLYRIFLFAIDLDELPELHRRLPLFSHGKPNLYSFRESDYLPSGEPLHNDPASSSASVPRRATPTSHSSSAGNLKTRVTDYLFSTRGLDLTDGRVVLVTLPRVFGYLFNPVSFYFCYDRTGAPVAALAEVTNTFREMKPYLLGPESLRTPGGSSSSASSDSASTSAAFAASAPSPSPATASARSTAPTAEFHTRTPKHFYVSPFSDVDVSFDFTLRAPTDRLSIRIDDYVGAERTLTSTLTGPRRALTSARLAWFTLKYPLLTLRIIALIHLHALKLWLKRVPWFAKAARPADQRALYRPHSSLSSAAPAPSLTAAPSPDAL